MLVLALLTEAVFGFTLETGAATPAIAALRISVVGDVGADGDVGDADLALYMRFV